VFRFRVCGYAGVHTMSNTQTNAVDRWEPRMSIIAFIKCHLVSSFFALAFAYSWIWWGVLFVVAPKGFEAGRAEMGALALYGLFGAAGSSVASIVITRVVDGRDGLQALFSRLGKWRVNFVWYGAALLVTPLLLTVILLALSFVVSPVFLPAVLTSRDIATLLGFGIIVGLVAGFFEELGWTGFAIPKLQIRYGALATGLIVGVLWGIWHFLPDFWGRVGSFGALYIPNYVVFVIGVVAYRILIVWVYNNSKGSLLLAVLMHASFSGSQAIFIPALSAADWVLVQAVFAAVLWLVVAFVVAMTGKRLVRESRLGLQGLNH
jgi:membrane protease YdiL (CAAX protease family)